MSSENREQNNEQDDEQNNLIKWIGLFSGVFVAIITILFFDLEPGKPQVTRMLAVVLLMAIWWITEAAPIAVTSLLPLALLPTLGILNGNAVSQEYANYVIFLFLGGFLMAIAMERWNLHRRIALNILLLTGSGPSRILFGFMSATAFLSMWMSNTATTMMLLPIIMSVIVGMEKESSEENLPKIKRYAVGLLIGTAYSASIGGISTLVGTPPNLAFAQILKVIFPTAPDITFVNWMIFALPLSILMFIFVFFYLSSLYCRCGNITADRNVFRDHLKKMGPITGEERIVFVVFLSLAFLWIFRKNIELGFMSIPGWSSLFPYGNFINDGTVAIAVSALLFVLPAPSRRNQRILNWKDAKAIPWGIVLLFGGGFALAAGFGESGLSLWIGDRLAFASGVHPLLLILIISLTLSFLTEFTSNTATTQMLLPVLAGMAVEIRMDPLLIMIPATLSASLAFMFPVATPPNAIVFGSGRLQIKQMVKTGFLLNMLGVTLVSLYTYFLGGSLMGIRMDHFPTWAAPVEEGCEVELQK